MGCDQEYEIPVRVKQSENQGEEEESGSEQESD